MQSSDLHNFGCSIAIDLFLNFLLRTSLLLVIMFVIAFVPTVEMISRNYEREHCRSLLSTSYHSWLSLTSVGSASLCGYAGLNVTDKPPEVRPDAAVSHIIPTPPSHPQTSSLPTRSPPPPQALIQRSFLVLPSLGACEEYYNVPDIVIQPALPVPVRHEAFVQVSCHGPM